MAQLAVNDVRKSFGVTEALRGVSFTIDQGEMFGLLGPNGAGKTTLMSILAGLLEANAGGVLWLGQNVTTRNRDVRRLIGIVPQELALYGELTAAENLRFFGSLYGVRGQELNRRVERILTALGLEDRAHGRVGTFSGGMQRRLNLGAALVHEPRLLLLDEPTAGVDPQSRRRLFDLVRGLHREGMTIVYTSHYMEEVQALCPRIGIIDHGRLIACDTVAQLLQRLPGRIVVQVHAAGDGLRDRIASLAGVAAVTGQEALWDISCQDVPATLLNVLAAARDAGAELTVLEMERPNLERVFLHLTGHALRD